MGEVRGTLHILHEAALGKCAISSISDEVQYNYAMWTVLGQSQQELTLILHTIG